MTFQRLKICVFLACVLVVLSWGAAPGRAGVAPAQQFIHLQAGSFDPLQALPTLPARLTFTPAQAAASALVEFTDMDARSIVQEAMKIAASICIYTNDIVTIEEI